MGRRPEYGCARRLEESKVMSRPVVLDWTRHSAGRAWLRRAEEARDRVPSCPFWDCEGSVTSNRDNRASMEACSDLRYSNAFAAACMTALGTHLFVFLEKVLTRMARPSNSSSRRFPLPSDELRLGLGVTRVAAGVFVQLGSTACQ